MKETARQGAQLGFCQTRKAVAHSGGRSVVHDGGISPLSKIYHCRWLFGIPRDFRDRVRNYPEYFNTVVEEDEKRVLKLVTWDRKLAVSALERDFMIDEDGANKAFQFKVTHGKLWNLGEKDERKLNLFNTLPLGWRNQVDESVPPPPHGWDTSSFVIGDEAHLYGRLNWDRRSQLSNLGWDQNGEMWMGQNVGSIMEVQLGQQKDEYSVYYRCRSRVVVEHYIVPEKYKVGVVHEFLSLTLEKRFYSSLYQGRFSNGLNAVDYIDLGFKDFIPPYATVKGKGVLTGVNYASAGSGILDETGENVVI
ncbi:hypothetical protein L1987_03591 [Smallanthus sonchifolius]|uniref:Uncharacterized protein n=1 Tax=Smallanthus sonchifolius TaxID=185202 RepID=A0ACB9KB49_9ASTR|nr:hypothetical protein L1987_03591 [Smallanthus sonchifolius]